MRSGKLSASMKWPAKYASLASRSSLRSAFAANVLSGRNLDPDVNPFPHDRFQRPVGDLVAVDGPIFFVSELHEFHLILPVSPILTSSGSSVVTCSSQRRVRVAPHR